MTSIAKISHLYLYTIYYVHSLYSLGTCHLCEQLNEKCDKLYEKLSAMEEKSRQQSDKFSDILAEHKVLLMELTHQNKALQTLKGIFPIKSTEELKNLDELLEIQPEIYLSNLEQVFYCYTQRKEKEFPLAKGFI
ncbi:PREDICTED: uncharacterized protein LOC108360358 [Rhagoletis zephyria]|uniref:uncharacterized protein LOC108360358 n=1 Tax=Rhagoletis zephyria TaxID=28612 RepID=UPI0008116939|nr:PREDICTED: uncharacterized protein LOC108360358 [Rhagoletis zephyria]XP_036334878.1 uncharacterized protein LOC118745539 isoform X1 [Rhagoletis pomonella]